MFRKIMCLILLAGLSACSLISGQNSLQASTPPAPTPVATPVPAPTPSCTGITTAAMTAGNGIRLSFVDEKGSPASQFYVMGHKVRMESCDAQAGGAIYDAAAHTLTVLMPKRHAYMVLDQQSAAQMGIQMQDLQKQMQAQMANLPPDQRAAMEQMMAQRGLGNGQSKIEARDLGSTATVAGYPCRNMQIVTNGVPGLKMCVAALSSLSIPSADITTLNAMRTDMTHMMASLGPMAQAYSTLQTTQGFAIRREVPRREGYTMVTGTETLKSITRGDPPADLFEIPAGYKKTDMQQMMKAGG